MIIKLPNGKQIVVRGQMMWSNLNGREDTGALVDMGFSFIKMSEQDQKVLRTVISLFGEGGNASPNAAEADGYPKNPSSDLARVCSVHVLPETQ